MISKIVRNHPVYGLNRRNRRECFAPSQEHQVIRKYEFFSRNLKKLTLLGVSSLFNIFLITAIAFVLSKTFSRLPCCDSMSLLSGSKCVPKRTYSMSCLNDNSCRNDLGLSCINNTCNCSLFLWDGSQCMLKKNETISCTQNKECLGDMVCHCGVCECSNTTTHFFNHTDLSCTPKTLNNTICESNITCRSYLGLICTWDYFEFHF